MATYRVISLDLRTKTRITELEVENLKYGHRLNSVGTIEGKVSLPARQDAESEAKWIAACGVINDALDPGRRMLVVERDGVVVGDGIVWAVVYDNSDQSYTLSTVNSMWSIFRRRVMSARLTFNDVDQLTIAREIIDAAQAVLGGDLGIVHNSTLSNVLRDRTYESWELKNVAEAIEQLAGVINGFDFAIDCTWHPATDVLVPTLNLSYPRRGRSFQNTGHVFEVGTNVIDFNWPSDASAMATKVWGAGAGEGAAMLTSSDVAGTQLQPIDAGGAGYPLLEEVLINKDVRRRSTLDAQVSARLHARQNPIALPTFSVYGDTDPILGSYITGDAARFRVPAGEDPRFPAGLNTFRRIYGYDVTVSSNGEERVDIIPGEEPV
jgi:hypothetical protein